MSPNVEGDDFVAHLFVIQTEERASLQQFLTHNGIASDIHYPLLDYQQPSLAAATAAPHLETSERLLSRILTLPCYPELQSADIERACETIGTWDPR